MGNTIAFQLVRNDLSRRLTMRAQQSFEEFLGCCPVTSALQKHIDGFSVLVDSSPQIVLDTTYFDEYLVYVESVADTPMTVPQSSRITGTKFVTP